MAINNLESRYHTLFIEVATVGVMLAAKIYLPSYGGIVNRIWKDVTRSHIFGMGSTMKHAKRDAIVTRTGSIHHFQQRVIVSGTLRGLVTTQKTLNG
jgi:hypothetical protein